MRYSAHAGLIPAVVILTAGVALWTAAEASAVRLPTPVEARAITAATKQALASDSGISASRIKVSFIRVSTVDRRFARADAETPGVTPAVVVLVRRANGWAVRTYGTASAGCSLPLNVRVDLWLENCRGSYP